MKKGKKKNHKKHFLRKYKRRLRKNIEKEVLLIFCKDIDSIDINRVPQKMFQYSALPNDSIINNTENDSFRFTIGYASVAVNLLGICQYCKSNLVKDSFILPALHCFRIYLENIMKENILFLNKDVGEKDLIKHDLHNLWEMQTRYMNSDSTTKQVRKYIEEFNNYDPDSTAFRYSHIVNKKLGKNKGQVLDSSISIDSLRSAMLYIYRFMEGLNELARQSNDIND